MGRRTIRDQDEGERTARGSGSGWAREVRAGIGARAGMLIEREGLAGQLPCRRRNGGAIGVDVPGAGTAVAVHDERGCWLDRPEPVVHRGLRRADEARSWRLSQARPIPQVRTLPCPPPRRATTEKSAQRAPEPRARRPRGTPPPSRPRRAFGRCSSRCRSRKIEAGTPRPRDRRRKRRQPEVRQDGHDNVALREVGDDRPPPTARAGQNVHQINAP
jgi:hypothetical protein